ncbi:unnamed protein product [Protopolystoma xenopodis]|uniref:Uncharacterized protein n=1 Tax=Protopolystoma xenopodis TaxID=117903 RepID=A0A3S5ADM2_9PLAT|nr:unnamed protein product [Protopolystoma xenopodis]
MSSRMAPCYEDPVRGLAIHTQQILYSASEDGKYSFAKVIDPPFLLTLLVAGQEKQVSNGGLDFCLCSTECKLVKMGSLF